MSQVGRKLSKEHLAKLAAGRARAKERREAEKAATKEGLKAGLRGPSSSRQVSEVAAAPPVPAVSEGKVLLPVDPRSFFCEIQSPVDAQAILEAVTIDDRPGPTELRLRLEKWMQGAAYQQVMATTQGPVSLPASVPGLSAPSKEALGDMPPPGAGRGQAPVVRGTWGPGHGERPPGV